MDAVAVLLIDDFLPLFGATRNLQQMGRRWNSKICTQLPPNLYYDPFGRVRFSELLEG
jgi:hypothetical protein